MTPLEETLDATPLEGILTAVVAKRSLTTTWGVSQFPQLAYYLGQMNLAHAYDWRCLQLMCE